MVTKETGENLKTPDSTKTENTLDRTKDAEYRIICLRQLTLFSNLNESDDAYIFSSPTRHDVIMIDIFIQNSYQIWGPCGPQVVNKLLYKIRANLSSK